MTLLQDILKEIKSDDNLEKVRLLCDQIKKEEPQAKHPERLPYGPNILLSLEVPGRNSKEIAFLALERESEDLYLSVLYTIPLTQVRNVDITVKRQRVWEIHDHRPEKILTQYAKVIKYLRGE